MKIRKFTALAILFVMVSVFWIPVKAEDIPGGKKENLHYSIPTLNGGTVSTAAEGRPKVLIFYKTVCYNCQTVLGLFQNERLNFSGVDVIAAEISNASMEEMEQFYKTYGTDQITYGYDARRIMWNYIYSIDSNIDSVTTPVIVFIDRDDHLVHYTTGMNYDILSDIETYLGISLTGTGIKGDIDGSGKVDIQDLRLVLRAVCNKIQMTEVQRNMADVTENGKVDIQDLQKILRFLCGKIQNL